MQLDTLNITAIHPHPRNPRRDLGDLTELAASIKAQGLIQPVVVARRDDGYVLIAGHRRHRAATLAGHGTVPALIRDDLTSDAQIIEAMLIENVQRTDLTALEEADAYAQLELLGVKEAAMAQATGRAPKTVKERLLIAGLPAERREQIEAGTLSVEGAVKCGRLRAKYAGDTGALELIDKAGVWSFSGGSLTHLQDRIERLIADRHKPTAEPIEDVDDDTDNDISDDTDQGTIADAERAVRAEQWADQEARLMAWLNSVTLEDLTTVAFSPGLHLDDLDDDDAARCGIDPDNVRTITFDQAVRYLALQRMCLSGVEPHAWQIRNDRELRDRAEFLDALGIELNDYDRELCTEEPS